MVFPPCCHCHCRNSTLFPFSLQLCFTLTLCSAFWVSLYLHSPESFWFMRSAPLFTGPIVFLSVAQQGARPHLLHLAVFGPDMVSNLFAKGPCPQPGMNRRATHSACCGRRARGAQSLLRDAVQPVTARCQQGAGVGRGGCWPNVACLLGSCLISRCYCY